MMHIVVYFDLLSDCQCQLQYSTCE